VTQRITLEEQRAPGYPVVKRTALDQVFNGAVLKAEARDRMKRGDGGESVVILNRRGNPAQEMVVTTLVLPGTTAPAGLGDEEGVPEPGDIVRLILKGKSFADWIEAKKSLPNNTVAVGDVVSTVTNVAQVYDAQGNPSGPEITDQAAIDAARLKSKTVGIYGTVSLRQPKEGSEWYAKAVSAYHAMQERVTAETNAEVSSDTDDDIDF
jgi:hypothetical protein